MEYPPQVSTQQFQPERTHALASPEFRENKNPPGHMGDALYFVGAMLRVDDAPNDIVGLHVGGGGSSSSSSKWLSGGRRRTQSAS